MTNPSIVAKVWKFIVAKAWKYADYLTNPKQLRTEGKAYLAQHGDMCDFQIGR